MNDNKENSIITISLKGVGSECCQGLITKEYYDVFKNKYYNTELIDNGWSDFLEKELQLGGYWELSDILSVVGIAFDLEQGEMSIVSSEDDFPFEYSGKINLEELGPLDGDPDLDSSYIGWMIPVTDQYGKEVVSGLIDKSRSKGFSTVRELVEGKKLVTVRTSEFFEVSIDIPVPSGSFELGKLHFLIVTTDMTGYGNDYGDFIVGVTYEDKNYYFDYPGGCGNAEFIEFE